ncbi:sulfur carrier protein ThiS [Blastococcus sp. PRF04-17]|uniref:sulfur carrier protein ThiS n=1 Tax=Blastococcus sp. PRF04-17 TaxID=2933797 RepID=UPI001FF4676C|nr:sulfur carrier protein ThiS [Blastococcus sp. PRF04-17]UOY02472.1 sulfur carrier protein ThiS [Blastococcus sp. PRF04-17]
MIDVQVTVNGRAAGVEEVATVAALVASRGQQQRVAVALNGEVVPRSRWETTGLAPGDSVEVLAPTAGG